MAVNIQLDNANESSATWRIFGDFPVQSPLIIDQAQFAQLPNGRLKKALTTVIGPSDDKVLTLMNRMAELGYTSNSIWNAYPRYSTGLPVGELVGCTLGYDSETDLPRLEMPMNFSYLFPDNTPGSNTMVTVSIRYSASE